MTTDASGRFRLPLDAEALGDDAVMVRASFAGQIPSTQVIAISSGDSVSVDLRLASGPTGTVLLDGPPRSDAWADDGTASPANGVDPGGIVRVIGDHLVVLRRGRLFTVRVGGGDLTPVDDVSVAGPWGGPEDVWYHEVLTVGTAAIVVGEGWDDGHVTEVTVFDVGADGRIKRGSTYRFPTEASFPSLDDGAQVVGDRLVVYAPAPLYLGRETEPATTLPVLRRWDGRRETAERVSPSRIHRPRGELARHDGTVHTVLVCGVGGGALDCRATGVVGPSGATPFVTEEATYLWLWSWRSGRRALPPILYRVPHDGDPPQAVAVDGPLAERFPLHVARDTVSAVTTGCETWKRERTCAAPSVVRVPVSAFGDDVEGAALAHSLPAPGGTSGVSRFVDGRLLRSPSPGSGVVHVVNVARPNSVWTVHPGHPVGAIEPMEDAAVLQGWDGNDLLYSVVHLDGTPRITGPPYRLRGARRPTTRSQGFFYQGDGQGGLLGLQVRRLDEPYQGASELGASVVFIHNEGGRLREIGVLHSQRGPFDDECVTSCTAWYANARPVFVGDRVFALLGYEVVEGVVRDGALHEIRRVSFDPSTPPR